MKHRGMSGCLRQAIVNAKLEHKLTVDDPFQVLYNNKYGSNQRYFKWLGALKVGMNPAEQKRYLAELGKLLPEYDLTRTSYNITGRSIHIWCNIGNKAKVDELKVRAKHLGYRLVKLPAAAS